MSIGHHVYGSGPHKVMVLHGWFGDHSAFEPMHVALSPDEFSYCFVDYRGYSTSRHIDGHYTMDEIAHDVLELATHLGWRKFSLVGHSMGGMAIQRVLVDAPQRVEKLVGITPVPASGYPFDDAGWALFHGATDSLESRIGIIDFTTGSRQSRRWVTSTAEHSMHSSKKEAFAGYLVAWGKTDFSSAVKALQPKHPMLVLLGEHDPALNPALMKSTFLEWYSNATMEILPACGHYPMNETPIGLATRIERFLRE